MQDMKFVTFLKSDVIVSHISQETRVYGFSQEIQDSSWFSRQWTYLLRIITDMKHIAIGF